MPEVDLPKPPSPPKKKMIEPELILVSSSGEPSGPKSHISPKILTLRLLLMRFIPGNAHVEGLLI
jgi:hypothetical protein